MATRSVLVVGYSACTLILKRKQNDTQKDSTRNLTSSCFQVMTQAHKAARKAELLRANEFHELSTSLQVPYADRDFV